jgi:putative peptidoglycan lipid II flippase
VRLARLAGDGSLAWWRRRHEAAVQPSRVAAPLCMMAGENLFSRGGVLLERAFGAALEAGAISVLSYSTRLISLPFNVLVPVVSFPIFPRFVSAIAAGDRRRCARLLAQGIATSLLLTAGALAVLLVWRREIIALAFQRGEFTAADTELVSQTLVWHAIGGAGWAVRNICERLLWAAKRNAWSLASGAAAFVLQLGLAPALVHGPQRACAVDVAGAVRRGGNHAGALHHPDSAGMICASHSEVSSR